MAGQDDPKHHFHAVDGVAGLTTSNFQMTESPFPIEATAAEAQADIAE